jgi:hypothetical protein
MLNVLRKPYISNSLIREGHGNIKAIVGHTGLRRYMHTMSAFLFLDLAVKMTPWHVLNADPVETLL